MPFLHTNWLGQLVPQMKDILQFCFAPFVPLTY